MCLSCGCGKPHEDHGNPDNITQEKLQKAADASKISLTQAADNIKNGLSQAGSGGGQQRRAA
jgi:hypothetical protein